MFRVSFGAHLRRRITWELVSRCVADCPHLGYGSTSCSMSRGRKHLSLKFDFVFVPVTVLPSSICSILASAIPKMFLSVCQPDHAKMNIAFVGYAGHRDRLSCLRGLGRHENCQQLISGDCFVFAVDVVFVVGVITSSLYSHNESLRLLNTLCPSPSFKDLGLCCHQTLHNEINLAGSEGFEGLKFDNIKPRQTLV